MPLQRIKGVVATQVATVVLLNDCWRHGLWQHCVRCA
jgi:hypothetical protein